MEWSITEMVQTVGSLFQLKKNQNGNKGMDTEKEILGKEKSRVNMV